MDEKKRIEQQASCSHDWVPLAENSRIGEYRIVEILSHNGQSITYRAQDCIIGDTVRIQEFFPRHMAKRCEDGVSLEPLPGCVTQFKYFRASFMDLYQTLAAEKDNPCLIPIIQIFEQNATVYVVSEYWNVKTLEEYLAEKGGKEYWCCAKRYLMPLYNSLSNLHKKGITHQGICPKNIVLDEKMNPFFMGFSLSEIRTARGDLDSELFAGYSAPEQYQPESWQGSWTDVYSIAAVTYRVLTGVLPPDAGNLTAETAITPADVLEAEIPENVSEALEQAMQPDRTKRYESVDLLLEKLLETTSSNTAVFRVEGTLGSESASENTTIFRVDGATSRVTVHLPEEEEEKTSRVKTGSVYLLITMAATLLLLVVGAPKMYRYLGSTWEAFSRDYSLEGTGEEESSTEQDTPKQEQSAQETEPHKVENFVGRKGTDVLGDARYEQWYYFETVEEYNETFEKGVIYNQSVTSGTEINRKTTVTLYISKGSESEPLPELSGKSMEEAIQILSGMGKKWRVVEGENSSVEPGQIFRTDPPAGTALSKNSSDTVLLYVAVERQVEEPPKEESDDSQKGGIKVITQKNSERKVIKKTDSE